MIHCKDCDVRWSLTEGRNCWMCGVYVEPPPPARVWAMTAMADQARARQHAGERG